MKNVLIRGLSDRAVESIDAEASALGLSRNEFLRRKFETAAAMTDDKATVTTEDWERSSRAFGDLMDDDIMAAAWH
ncbi:type II toxin-antitoxin system VapB family antitoxin [Kocuria marina]|uniref:type II toxin-antitoxin system VapB family antitoxin n=1 Tax=Kocuria marina TaxID=223184 RepID=UPI0019D05ACB|nr:hypothetical protein [Kocuria indica]MBN6811842.1 hypothetical protein [Kocuria indica]MBN6843536.1 hypothetical protein [Kocuria indica]